jgi:hypothetical protein
MTDANKSSGTSPTLDANDSRLPVSSPELPKPSRTRFYLSPNGTIVPVVKVRP